jgi:hypothetical protein
MMLSPAIANGRGAKTIEKSVHFNIKLFLTLLIIRSFLHLRIGLILSGEPSIPFQP